MLRHVKNCFAISTRLARMTCRTISRKERITIMVKLPEVEFDSEQIKRFAKGELASFSSQSFKCYENEEVTEDMILRRKMSEIRDWGGLSLEEMKEAITNGPSKQKMLDILQEWMNL